MTVTDRYRTLGDLPSAIPVFPLLGCILLPRATLRLSIFEPRYLQLVEDAIAVDRLIGIIQPADQESGTESPAGKAVELRAIGCAGRITGFEEHEDGRMTIILTGIARFRIEDEIETPAQYRRMSVAWDRFAADLERGFGEVDIDRGALLDALKSYLDARRLQADWEAIERSGSERLVNALSVMSPYGPEEKQALLEAPTLKERANVLLALAQMELASGSRGGDTRRRLQ